MAIRTADAYRRGLIDDRSVWYRGKKIVNVNEDAELRVAIDHSAIAYDLGQDPSNRELAIDTICGEDYSAMYKIPRSAEDLRRRSQLIELTAEQGGGMIVLKEVGTDALFALLRILQGDELAKAQTFFENCRKK